MSNKQKSEDWEVDQGSGYAECQGLPRYWGVLELIMTCTCIYKTGLGGDSICIMPEFEAWGNWLFLVVMCTELLWRILMLVK